MKISNAIFWCWLGAASAAISGELPVTFDAPPERARVVQVENPMATTAFVPNLPVVQDMVNAGIQRLTGKSDAKSAWQTYVRPNDVIGIKVYCGPGPNSGTRPAVVEAVVHGILETGIAPANVIVWDKNLGTVQSEFSNMAEHYGIRLAGSADAGYDAKVFYDNEFPGTLSAGDLEFDQSGTTTGRHSYVSKLLTGSITKIISIAPLLNHNLAGTCGHLYGLAMGSVDNTIRFLPSGYRLARAVPETYAMHALSDHVVLCITDALIGQYQGEEMSLLHYSTVLNQIWFSTDPVALDSLAVQELDREREAAKLPANFDNPELFQIAVTLQLGVSDLSKIRLDVVR